MVNHTWTVKDDVVAYFLYKYGDKDLLYSVDTIGENLGMGSLSLRSRVANFKYLDKGMP